MTMHMNKVGKSSEPGLLPWRIISKPLPSHPLGLLLLLFFLEYALTWYTSWKDNFVNRGQPLEWKVLVEGLCRNATTKYPERHAKKCVYDMVFKGDIHKYITYYQTQLACIPSGEETLATQVHNFIVKLPPLLREKMQDK